jgi:hypothetical protein
MEDDDTAEDLLKSISSDLRKRFIPHTTSNINKLLVYRLTHGPHSHRSHSHNKRLQVDCEILHEDFTCNISLLQDSKLWFKFQTSGTMFTEQGGFEISYEIHDPLFSIDKIVGDIRRHFGSSFFRSKSRYTSRKRRDTQHRPPRRITANKARK